VTRAQKFCFILLLFASTASAQGPNTFLGSGFFERRSLKSNFDFKIYNDGLIFEDDQDQDYSSSTWPRGIDFVDFSGSGFWFGCVKEDKKLVSSIFLSDFGHSFNQFVPGVIGDPHAKPDTVFGGSGWKYVNDVNYITYSSSDYDATGTDVSGNNYPDWPLRIVNGGEQYVQNKLERAMYSPSYKSDEEFFSVFKDTETGADNEYQGFPGTDSSSYPIGIEAHQTTYTFGGGLKDMLIINYDIYNKSGKDLDSCICGYLFNVFMDDEDNFNNPEYGYYSYYAKNGSRRLLTLYNPTPLKAYGPVPYYPNIGLACLNPVQDTSGNHRGTMIWKASGDYINHGGAWSVESDSTRYNRVSSLPQIDSAITDLYALGPIKLTFRKLLGVGPFSMKAGESIKFAIGIMFANGLPQLLAYDDILQKVYDKGIVTPAPPTQPQLTVAPAQEGILLKWDNAAELSHDPVIADSLGKPFAGYRLYRGHTSNGPFSKIREWQVGRDSIVHDYLDLGKDGADTTVHGLLSNVQYYYKLTAFDEGAPLLNMPEMESAGIVTPAVQSVPASSPYQLSNIRVVPNPFVVTHAAQQSTNHPVIFFDYLPEVCTIRIYNVALQLVAIIHHQGGSSEQWNLQTQGGQLVASQLLIANIQTPQGTSVIKKFAVVLSN